MKNSHLKNGKSKYKPNYTGENMEYKEIDCCYPNSSLIKEHNEEYKKGAFKFKNSQAENWFNGKRHRENAPAYCFNVAINDGLTIRTECYYSNGLIHNENGPAVIKTEIITKDNGETTSNEQKFYYLNNQQLSFEKWQKQIQTKLYW